MLSFLGGINFSESSVPDARILVSFFSRTQLIPPKKLNMEGALEFCREDECVEVTPAVVRIRKVTLDGAERARATSRAKKNNQS